VWLEHLLSRDIRFTVYILRPFESLLFFIKFTIGWLHLGEDCNSPVPVWRYSGLNRNIILHNLQKLGKRDNRMSWRDKIHK
jgi:hypothetical protein